MTNVDSHDDLAPVPQTPAQSLQEVREARYEGHYRDLCEDSHGIIELGAEKLHPADILDALAKDAARRGRDEAREALRTDTEETACEQFPSPVAVPFHTFLHGSSDPREQLLHLRDTWESLVHLLSALLLSECASLGVSINGFKIRRSEANPFTACKPKDLRTDSLALRIGLIEGMLLRCCELGIELEVAKILGLEVMSEIRRLNAIRNGFSHEGAKSQNQARELLDEAYPLFREVLVDLSALGEVLLFRLSRVKPGSPPIAEVEYLNGHAQSRRLGDVPLDHSSGGVALGAAPVDGLDRVLAKVGPKILDLSPFFYALNGTSHRTRVAFFKFKKDGKWTMEVVGESQCIDCVETAHEVQMTRFYSLLTGGGDEHG